MSPMATNQETTVKARPYEARQCPECKVWVYTAAGPFAEGDRTKTEADWLHWEKNHLPESEKDAQAIGFPFFSYNEVEVEAVYAIPHPEQVAALSAALSAAAEHSDPLSVAELAGAVFAKVLYDLDNDPRFTDQKITCFSDLHDYVDANGYLIDASEELGIEWDFSDQVSADLQNIACDIVSARLALRDARLEAAQS